MNVCVLMDLFVSLTHKPEAKEELSFCVNAQTQRRREARRRESEEGENKLSKEAMKTEV